jgi:polyisoprenoid-binding protein YceI
MLLLRNVYLAGVISLAFAAHARAGDSYKFDQNGSTIAFSVRHLLGTARGQFHRFSGTIDLDREQPEKSSVSARIEVASIDTGISKRDTHLRSADFFDAQKFPAITFKSRAVKRTGERQAEVAGDLTMHGITRPMILHVEMLSQAADGRSRWKVTTAPLSRREFGLMFSSTAEAMSGISQDVNVNIEIEASRSQ